MPSPQVMGIVNMKLEGKGEIIDGPPIF